MIEEEYRDTFEDVVSEWLQKGYLPLGGVSTYVDRWLCPLLPGLTKTIIDKGLKKF